MRRSSPRRCCKRASRRSTELNCWTSTGRTHPTARRPASTRRTRRHPRRPGRCARPCCTPVSSRRTARSSDRERTSRTACSRRASLLCKRWRWSRNTARTRRTIRKRAWRRRTRRRLRRPDSCGWRCCTPAPSPRTVHSRCRARRFRSSCSRPASRPCTGYCSSPSTARTPLKPGKLVSTRRSHCPNRRRGKCASSCCRSACSLRIARSTCRRRRWRTACSRPASRPYRHWRWLRNTARTHRTTRTLA